MRLCAQLSAKWPGHGTAAAAATGSEPEHCAKAQMVSLGCQEHVVRVTSGCQELRPFV